MKYLLFLLVLTANINFYAQEPPPYIKFNFKNLAINKKNLLERYAFSTFVYKEGIISQKYYSKKNKNNIVEKGYQYENEIFNIQENFLSLFIRGYRPNVNDIFLLNIQCVESKRLMNIFIRSCYLLDFSEEIILNNVSFYEGNYFYDMCNSKCRFEIPCSEKGKININLEHLRRHKVSIKRLNKYITKDNCK